MSSQATFSLRGRNPDVLTCIANLSNDEVFTPPEFANRMLDTLAEAWATDNDGASIWENPDVKFLDPCTKSGVFLREITTRLTKGLEQQIPDLQERVDHILTRQVFGIGITELTALLARRSVYCSKHARGTHSIGKSFTRDDGNIRFERVEHTWHGGKCRYCRASQGTLNRGEGLETHAYDFIHTDDIKARIAELFGADMQFDVIIGNPPYQLREENSGEGNSASPIYQKFVGTAQSLDPRYVIMVTPTRWVAGGKGLDEYRATMLSDRRLRSLIDYSDPSEVFPGVNIRGGASYFLWDAKYDGECQVTTIKGGETVTAQRSLDEFDVFVKDPRAVEILRKVLAKAGKSLGALVSARNPFGLGTNFYDVRETANDGDLTIHYIRNRKRAIGFVAPEAVTKNLPAIMTWKVFVAKAGTDGSATPDAVLTRPIMAGPTVICTDSFLYLPFGSKREAESAVSYYATRFFRFLVSLRKLTQDASRDTYSWVPVQTWDRAWTDAELYKEYALTKREVAYIESVIKTMTIGNEDE